ncbi:hypothetical protein D3C71_1676670 [compost metagenome]
MPTNRIDGVWHVDRLAFTNWFAAVETFQHSQLMRMGFHEMSQLQQNGLALCRML